MLKKKKIVKLLVNEYKYFSSVEFLGGVVICKNVDGLAYCFPVSRFWEAVQRRRDNWLVVYKVEKSKVE